MACRHDHGGGTAALDIAKFVKPGEALSKEDVLAFLAERISKWQMPDDVVFIDEVPKTSVGKFSKKTLRDKFGSYELPTA